MPAMYLAHAATRELEKDFVVVHSDRRDAGKSFDPHMPADKESVSQQLADAEALIGMLRQRFGARPALLVGHSWGSYLGVLLVQRHPEWFAAYVGMGQVTDTTRERAAADESVA
jgi:proline iminopeptidase